MRTSLLAVVVLAASNGFGFTTPAPELIRPSQAAKYVNRTVTLEMEVRSTATLRRGCYLNSEKDFRNSNNVTVLIDTDAREKFWKEDIRDPAAHFDGKTIEVTGTISLDQGKPQMKVSDPDNIRVVEKK